MNRDKIQKIVLLAVCVIAGSYGYISFLYGPLVAKGKELTEQLETEKKALEEAKQKQVLYNQLKKDAEILKGRLVFAMKRLPSKEQIPEILRGINRMAVESNVNFLNFIPQQLATKGFYTEVPVKIELTSGYHNLGRFLDKLSDSKRLMLASDLQFNAVGGGKASVKASMMLTAFVIAEDAETNKITGTVKEVVEPIRGLFYYGDGGDRADPMVPLTAADVERLLPGVDLTTLRLTGIISLRNDKVATLQDINNFRYVFRHGKLYTSSRREIPGVKGTVQTDQITLWRESRTEGFQKVTLKFEKK